MEFLFFKKLEESYRFARYRLYYKTENNNEKTYEIISRNKNLKHVKELQEEPTDSITLIMTNKEKDRILLNKEYRLAVADWVYNFPAGFIDEGETIEIAGARELYEETGLTLDHIEHISRDSYTAIGISNEKTACIIGTASGDFKKSSSENEEIHAGWFTKEQIKKLLKTENFATQTQCYCHLWCNT